MTKTKRLMAEIAASMVLSGAVPGTAAAQTDKPANPPQEKSQPDETSKTDPEVKKNADEIFTKVLKGTDSDTSKTLDQIAEQFSKLSRPQIEQALQKLVWDGSIRQEGVGTKGDPFRYYARFGGHGG